MSGVFKKLFSTHLAVILISFTFLSVIIVFPLKNYYQEGIAEKLEMSASLISELISEDLFAKESKRINQSALDLSEKIGVRITITDAAGVVLGDSEENPMLMENHAEHLEVRRALSGITGSIVRFSETTGVNMLYVALPVYENSVLSGVVRVSMPLSEVRVKINYIQRIIISSVLLGILIAVILSFLTSRAFAKPLIAMKEIASQMIKGDYKKRLDESSRDEVGQLARSFNILFDDIQKHTGSIVKDKEELSTILASMSEGVLVVDPSGLMLLWNDAFKEMFQIENISDNSDFRDILREKKVRNIITEALNDPSLGKREVIADEGGSRVILVHISFIKNINDEVRRSVIVFHDITRIKKLELVKTDFVSNVSHELKTPITAISASAETLIEGGIKDPAELNRFLRIIQEHSFRLNNIVNDLLLLSKIESDRHVSDFKHIEIKQLIQKLPILFENIVKEKNLNLYIQIAEDLKMIKGSEKNIEQVILNLLDNAVKFTPSGGEIKICAENLPEGVRLRVSDSGIGIPFEHLDRIFERFYRVDTARSREIGGTGLGLSIVKHIVQLYGGKVSVESRPGKGTEFQVIFPTI